MNENEPKARELSPNDLDELMDRDPLNLSAQDIDDIVAYHRRQRARRASGEKPEKNTAGPKIDLSSIIKSLKPAEAKPVITRRL